ncbi:hypothetical protein EMCRGX_G010414 [Ephydatia muelleri]
MAETAQLIQLLQKQMEEQRKQMEEGRKQTEALIAAFIGQMGQLELEQPSPKAPFQTFVGANSVPVEKRALVFLTNQSCVNYKLLSNLASQQSPPKDVNALTWDEIVECMKGQFDPTRYVVCKRLKYWSSMSRMPGESIQVLAARIHHDSVPCYSRPVGRGNAYTLHVLRQQ